MRPRLPLAGGGRVGYRVLGGRTAGSVPPIDLFGDGVDPIRIGGWIQEVWLRVFIEDLLRLIGDRPSGQTWEPCFGSRVSLVGERLDDRMWRHLRGMYHLTYSDMNTWAGVGWTGRCEVRCEFQMDAGYDGVRVWVEVADEQWAEGVGAAMVRANRHWSTHPEVPRSLFDGTEPFA